MNRILFFKTWYKIYSRSKIYFDMQDFKYSLKLMTFYNKEEKSIMKNFTILTILTEYYYNISSVRSMISIIVISVNVLICSSL